MLDAAWYVPTTLWGGAVVARLVRRRTPRATRAGPLELLDPAAYERAHDSQAVRGG
jgi:hypothetical protein